MTKIDRVTGVQLMRLWGVDSWVEPGAEYYLWDGCCVFALVRQNDFNDVHLAMNKERWRDCRKAGKSFLSLFGSSLLRAVILADRPHICNYAIRMGFSQLETKLMQTSKGEVSSFFVMWRNPGEYYGRSN
ncbi:hypothetical protein DVQ90_05130 [Yersinia enterocolitica]|uniref:hypothetical protein n=1 Tax=Yersinia enterocolitica TaxID=630 RepID=UPI003CFC04D1|nr:hypothetical protein [Yersinia enterocolitica]